MRDDVLKHLTRLMGAIEELLVEYSKMTDERKIEMDTRIEEKIKNINNIVNWSKHE